MHKKTTHKVIGNGPGSAFKGTEEECNEYVRAARHLPGGDCLLVRQIFTER